MASHAGRITLRETDGADKLTATYVYSENAVPLKQASPAGRVDVIDSSSSPQSWSTNSLVISLRDVFLPSGYPHSVTDDYLPYQLFDSLQAFCSSIAGLLSSRAVLQGVGVGNASASPTSALLLHILQDSSGRIATILFAHRVGTALEPECKMYRLAADVFNDIAMILDCLSPMVPEGVMRVSILSTAGVLRALCGVAGGSSKASLSAHFARWGNLAELNAKDSSQETVISLVGMLVGSVVVSHITGFKTTWAALLLLLACHLSMNYAAVRSVQMTSLNRQRANIVFSTLLSSDPDLDLERLRSDRPQGKTPKPPSTSTSTSNSTQWTVPTPAQVCNQEQIFHQEGALSWTGNQKLGTAEMGITLPRFFLGTGTSNPSTQTHIPLPRLTTLFKNESYLLTLSRASKSAWHARILLKKGSTVHDQLKAWTHALLAARVLSETPSKTLESSLELSANECGGEGVYRVIAQTLAFLNADTRFERYVGACVGAGWDVGIAALETKGGRRVILE